MNKMLLLIFAIHTISPAFATQQKKKGNNAHNDTTRSSLLWRISGKGLQRPSYIFGTIHLICPADYFWTDKMKESLRNTDEVCFEMNLGDSSIMTQAANSLLDTTGKTLRDYFTPAQFQKLEQYFQDTVGVQLSMFQRMKPIALETMVTSKSLNCLNPVSYEEKIIEFAKKQSKTITGLEDPAEQIALLETIPTDSVVSDIMQTIEGRSGDQDNYDDLISAYKKQDLPTLYFILQNSKETAIDMGAFLDDRNKKWISKIETIIARKAEFIAVGAGHLWGKNGVIALLREEGYKVVPVK
jgi:uncharacterized protein YbaP (TraB family)